MKDLVTSGSASKLTHINYAFGNVQGGKCTIGDSFAATEKAYTAEESVDGEADAWDQPLRGTFNQLKKLKAEYPHIKILWSFGGWTWSGGFGDAMKNPAEFAKSCNDLVNDERWEGVFDGIDLDWEYPNACGETCDDSGPQVMSDMMQAFRAEFGDDQLVTAAITADASDGGNIDLADYAGAAEYSDWYNVMTSSAPGTLRARPPHTPRSARTTVSRRRASTPRPPSTSSPSSESRLRSCCWASASTAAAGPASPSPSPAAARPGPPRARTKPASRTTSSSRRTARPPARSRGPTGAGRRPSPHV